MFNKYKSIAAIIAAIMLLSSCAEKESQEVSGNAEITETVSLIQTAAAQTTVTEASSENLKETGAGSEVSDTDTDKAQNISFSGDDELIFSVKEIIEKEFQNARSYSVRAGLYDFDTDGVPEVYAVRSDGGQGFMPVAVYSLDGSLLGELSGYCRDGYTRFYNIGENVYMHSFYEHSVHQRVETVDRIICENGSISSVPVTGKFGYTMDRFPILEYTYYADGEEADEKTYSKRYSEVYWDENKSAMINGVSIFAGRGFENSHDFQSENYVSEMAEYICGVYRSYENGKLAAREYTDCEPCTYAFDDYDLDGRYEAFIQVWTSSDKRKPELYFWNGEEIKCLTDPDSDCFNWFERTERYFIAQPLGNGRPCTIFGVKDGEAYECDISGYAMAMVFNYSVYSDYTIGDFFLEDSDWELAHTHKSYLFDGDFNERKGVPVTAEDFADDEFVYEDVKAAFEQIEADGGRVEGAYLRGGRYLNINYSYPANGGNADGFRLPAYKTYIVQNYVTLIDEGAGNYKESISEG